MLLRYLVNYSSGNGLFRFEFVLWDMEIVRNRGLITSQYIKIGGNSYEKVKTFEYLGSLFDQSIQEEIKCRLKARHSCYYSVQTLLSSRLLSKNLKSRIYTTTILPVVLYGCETWSLTLREECRIRVFENRILRRIFGSKRDENGEWRRLHNEELHSLYRSPNIVRVPAVYDVIEYVQ